MADAPVTILGVDTSLRSTGVGVLVSDGVRHQVKGFGTFACKRTWPVSRCLVHLQNELTALIEEMKPDVAAIEGIFYCRNVRTAVTLGQARGVVIAACAAAGLPTFEYAPRKVKLGMVGSGRASKDQVGQMVKTVLGLEAIPQEDAADALAIAYCHANQMRVNAQTDSHKPL